MARAAAKATPSRPRKATSARPRKAAPANRGHGEKATHDPAKHPRGPDGRFITTGGAKAKAKTTKAPKTTKTPTKPPAKPKPPKKVGTPKQRKGLADQIRKARTAAKTPEARKALLTQVRGLRQKRSEWKRGQGKTQVEKLPKAPKPPKEPKTKAKTPKAPKKPADPKPATVKPPKAKPTASKSAVPDLRSHYESIKHLPDDQKRQAVLEFVDKHKTPAASVKLHGMEHAEEMHSIPADGYNLHFPKDNPEMIVKTVRGYDLAGALPKELTVHTKDVYLSKQANKDDARWAKVYNNPGHESLATGGGGSVVFYNGGTPSRGYLAHEMGHNLATAKYGSTKPFELGAFSKATRGEKPPSPYAMKSPSEDFAESVRYFVLNREGFKRIAPKRYKVIDRMLKDPNYAG